MADDNGSSTPAEGIRFRPPTLEDSQETEGHKWEPRTPEHDDALAAPAPPPRPRRDDGGGRT